MPPLRRKHFGFGFARLGMGRRKTPDRSGTWKGWRRGTGSHLVRSHLVRNSSVVRVAKGPVTLGKRGKVMLERKAPKSTGCASKTRLPSRERQLGAKMPRRLARQEVALFVGRQLGDPPQIKFYGGGEGLLDFVERRATRRNVQVDADCFPSVSLAVRITLEVKDHFRLPGFRVIKSNISRQSTTGRLSLNGESPREPDEIHLEGQIAL